MFKVGESQHYKIQVLELHPRLAGLDFVLG